MSYNAPTTREAASGIAGEDRRDITKIQSAMSPYLSVQNQALRGRRLIRPKPPRTKRPRLIGSGTTATSSMV